MVHRRVPRVMHPHRSPRNVRRQPFPAIAARSPAHWTRPLLSADGRPSNNTLRAAGSADSATLLLKSARRPLPCAPPACTASAATWLRMLREIKKGTHLREIKKEHTCRFLTVGDNKTKHDYQHLPNPGFHKLGSNVSVLLSGPITLVFNI